jgi:hypothetical protein
MSLLFIIPLVLALIAANNIYSSPQYSSRPELSSALMFLVLAIILLVVATIMIVITAVSVIFKPAVFCYDKSVFNCYGMPTYISIAVIIALVLAWAFMLVAYFRISPMIIPEVTNYLLGAVTFIVFLLIALIMFIVYTFYNPTMIKETPTILSESVVIKETPTILSEPVIIKESPTIFSEPVVIKEVPTIFSEPVPLKQVENLPLMPKSTVSLFSSCPAPPPIEKKKPRSRKL